MTGLTMTEPHKQKSSGGKKEQALVKIMPRLTVAFILIVLTLLVLTSETASDLRTLFNKDEVGRLVMQVGNWGPLLIVVLMAVAVVFSPLPSAPIAVAAGAAYGHLWGTISVVVGASLGAIIAFTLARWLGSGFVRRVPLLPTKSSLQISQRTLMATIFAARLIPFISFDAVSYAAGLTKLSLLNFTMATVVGLIPMSFLLAHLGDQWIEAEGNELMSWVFIAGIFTLFPAAGYLWKRYRSQFFPKT